MSEIDKLEIIIEAEAQKANRSMGKLENKIDSVTEALERCMLVAQGAVSLKGLNIDKLFSGKAMEKSAKDMGKKLSDDLIKNFNLNLASKDVAGQVKSLSNKIANSLANSAGKPYKGAADDMEALGNIVKRHGQIAKTTADEYQELYNWIKKSGKIKISPATAKSLGDDYKNRTPVAKQKFSTKDGIELDSYYQELKDQFPTIIKEAYSVEDEFYQMENALRKFYETANSFYKPDWMEEDVWDSVINGVDDIRKSVINAKSGVTEFGDALQNAEESGKSFSQLFGANINTSGLDKAEKKLHSVSRVAQPKAKSKKLSLDDLFEKHSKVGTDLDVTGMSVKELQAGLKSATSSAERLNASLEKKLATQRSKELGVQIEGLVYDIQKATNQAEIFREALAKLPGSKPFEISTAKDADTSGGGYEQKVTSVPEEAMNYDASAMRAVYGEGAENLKNFNDVMDRFGGTAQEAFEKLNNGTNSLNTNKINTYEAQIKRLNAELEDMAKRGLTQGDPEYDRVMREKIEIAEAKRLYEKSMKEQAREDLGANEAKKAAQALKEANKRAEQFQRTLKKTAGFSNRVNNLAKALKNVGKTMKNARDIANKAAHPFRTLKELMGFESKKKNNGMPFGRMIGSSIMFSTIFGLISQIKQAIKEGSDNLVQYSGSYNNSISSMVSSLLYLKNAWAVAFAPIVNVVAPYISSFIDMVSSALNAVGHFLAALTGKGYVVQAKKAWKDYGASIVDTGKKTDKANDSAKKLQKTILGFDELNILNGNDTGSGNGSSGSGSGGSSGPSPSDMFETIEVSNSMNQLADKFKEAIKNSDFTEIGKMVGDKLNAAMESIPWDEIYHKADNFGKDLATFLNGLISPELFYNVGATVASSINTALHSLNSFAANFDWKDFGTSLASSITGFFETWDAKLTSETLSNFATGILESLKSAIDTLDGDKTFEKIGQKLVDFICGIDWKKLTWDLLGFFESLTNALVDFPKDFAKGVAQEILNKIFGKDKVELPKVKWFDDLTSWFSKMSIRQIPLFDVIFNLIDFKEDLEAIVTFFSDMKTNIEKALTPLADFFSSIFSLARENTQSPFAGIGDWFGERKSEIQTNMDSISTWFKTKYQGARSNVNSAFLSIGSWFGDRKKDVQNGMKDVGDWLGTKFQNGRTNVNKAFNDVGSWFGQRRTDIQTGVKDVDTWMNTKFTTARTNVNNAFSNVGSWFSTRKSEIQTGMNSIDTWMNTKYQSARGYVNSAFSNVGTWFGSRRGDIQSGMDYISTWFRDKFNSAYKGVTGAFSGIKKYFEDVGGYITSPIKSAINSVGSAVNWIYKKLGGSSDLIPRYATGTGKNGVLNDTFGMVNDQTGGTYRELVQFPNGKAFIPKGRNVVLPMPKGTKVMPAGQTKELMNMNGMPHFNKGAGVFNIIDYIAHPSKLLQYGLDKFTSFRDAVEPGLSIAKQSISAVKDMALSKVKSLVSGFTTSSGGGYSTSGVEQWRNLAKTALLLTNQYTESNLNALLTQMKHESGGNARAINLWDSNAKRGIPSKGLMQVIDPTFRSYAMAPYNKDIYDPLSNMIASIRYTVSRYGSLYKGWTARGYKGYKNGGMPVNGEVYIANENGFGSEYIGRMGNNHVVANNNQIKDGIKEAVIEGMMEVYMATQSNGADGNGTIPYIINAVLKTEDNEVLARAVEKGQASRSSRFNPSPAY
ncbi:transglycosylase SLT domain-containing protein [Mediterraneibacter faecis]|uniref:lytic transglycosylase domain-containing protein n=1 Tax=Mediterraneibacter faecis TaxID=592978 RepID=UPI003F9E3F90